MTIKKNKRLILIIILCINLFGCNESKWSHLNDEANFLYTQQKYDDGIIVGKQALDFAENKWGHEHINVVTSLNILASLYDSKKQYDQAEQLYKKAIKLQEKIIGSTHPDLAISLNNLASLYYENNKYDQAEPLYKRALDIREKNNPNSNDVANSINNLAILYSAQGKEAESRQLFEKLLKIQKLNLGDNNPEVIKTKDIIAKSDLKIEQESNQKKTQETQNIYKAKANLDFKGLALRMTYQEMDSLIKQTAWKYQFQADKGKQEQTISLKSESSAPVEFKLIGEKEIGGRKQSFPWQTTIVCFYEGIISNMQIFSNGYNMDEINIDLKNWLNVAHKALTDKYGQPETTQSSIEDINILKFNPSGFSPLYICMWRVNNQEIALGLYAEKMNYYGYIEFIDLDIVEKINKEVKVKTYM